MRAKCILICLVFNVACTQALASNPSSWVLHPDPWLNANALQRLTQEHASEVGSPTDMIVYWGSTETGPAYSAYHPIQSDNVGIGDVNAPFDRSDIYGIPDLQGVIWMGPRWLDLVDGYDHQSVLGLLAHETAHRWGSSFLAPSSGKQRGTRDLLGDVHHWNFFLDTGGSALRGNAWKPMGDGLFRAEPVSAVTYSNLDLYLMGLVSENELETVRLLSSATNPDQTPSMYTRDSRPVRSPQVVRAKEQLWSPAELVATNGERYGGYNATEIRQHWIYVCATATCDRKPMKRLQVLATLWEEYFNELTNGRGQMKVNF